MQVIDNFLQKEYYDHLYSVITDTQFPWLFQHQVATNLEDPRANLDHYYFVHSLFHAYRIESPLYDNFVHLFEALEVDFLFRARVLLYVNQGKQIIHDRHIDHGETCKTALIYMNSNDGFTEFETGERIDSVKNRLLVFDGSVLHSSSTPTNTKDRMLLSVTYV